MKRFLILLVLLAACGSPDMGANGVNIPYESGAGVSAPDSAAFAISGDLDLRIKLSRDDWTPSTQDGGIYQFVTAAPNDRSWALSFGVSGTLIFAHYADGTSASQVLHSSTDPLSFTDGTTHWVRAVHDVNNGAGGNDVKFYTSEDGSSWEQLGSTVTKSGTTTHFNSSQAIRLGIKSSDEGFGGTIYSAEIRDGIDGTIVANPDFVNDPAHSATAIRDSRGNLWTLSGSAALVSHTKPAGLGLAT